MDRTDVLREIFDDKIISILELFLDNPRKAFSLSEVSSMARVNVATSLRIIDRLVTKEILEIEESGKSKLYKLKQSQKTLELAKMLRKEDHISEFVQALSQNPRVKAIILDSRTKDAAKMMIVGNFLPTDQIRETVNQIQSKYNFKIQYMELNEKQFQEMASLGLYDINDKVLWKRGS